MHQFVVKLTGSSGLTRDDFVEVGPDCHILACRAVVESSRGRTLHLLGLATTPDTVNVTLAALKLAVAREKPGIRGVLVTESEEGSAVAAIDDASIQDAPRVAAAVAVMRVCWAWDESQTICVRVNGHGWIAAPHVDGEHWTATVSAQVGGHSP